MSSPVWANRSLFHERLTQYLSAASRERNELALVLINVERFKTINDTFGRQIGDVLLKQVAARLVELTKDPNHVARVGADHFAILVPRVKVEENLMRRLEGRAAGASTASPICWRATELRISTSAGIAMFRRRPGRRHDCSVTPRRRSKKSGSGEGYLFYRKEMNRAHRREACAGKPAAAGARKGGVRPALIGPRSIWKTAALSGSRR